MTKLILYFSIFTILCLKMSGEVVQSPVNTIWDSQNGRYLVVQNNNQLVSVDSMMTNSSVLLTLGSTASIYIQGNRLYVAEINKVIGYNLSTMLEDYRFVFQTDVSLKGITGDGYGNLYLSDALNNSIFKLGIDAKIASKLDITLSDAAPKGLDYFNDNLYITAAVTSGVKNFVYKYSSNPAKLEKIYNTTVLTGLHSVTHDKFSNLYFCFYGAGSSNGTVVKCSAADYASTTIKSNLSIPTSMTYREDIESLILSLNPINQIGFVLVGTASKPILQYPSNNSKIDESKVVFKWAQIQGVAGYNLWIAKDKEFANPESIRIVNCTNNTSSLVPLDTNTTYYWKVQGYNLGINGRWSDTYTFITGNIAINPPILSSPINGATSVAKRPTLVWNRAYGGIYELQVSRNIGFTDIKYEVKNMTDTFHLLERDLELNSEYYWRVRAYASSDNLGVWSIPFEFSTYATPPAAPELFYPGDYNVNISRVTVLEWMSVPNTKLYKLELSTRSDFLASSTQYFEIVPLNASKEVLQIVDSLGPYIYYYWRVRGENDYGLGPWSVARVFQTVNQGSPNSVKYDNSYSLVYPNPTEEYLNVDVQLNASAAFSIELFNSLGELQLVPEYTIADNSTRLKIITSRLSRGKYLLRILNGDKSFIVNFVKN